MSENMVNQMRRETRQGPVRPLRLLSALLALWVLAPPLYAQAQYGSPQLNARGQVQPYIAAPPGGYAPNMQLVQAIEEDDEEAIKRPTKKPFPSMIESMPGVFDELEVIHNRSQLVIARNRVVKTAIADPSVIEYVQFSDREFGVVGLQIGSTTLALWFEGVEDPVIYLVKVIRDPSLEDQKRIDYGKLERKIATLFPDSKVYLIPLSHKVIVKGQARDSEEAAQILSIVRGEFIDQTGSLYGPQPGIGGAAGGVGGIGGAGGGFNNGTNNLLGGSDLLSGFIVNMLEVPGEYQIMLHVKVAELNRSMLRRMGVDIDYLINGGRHAITAVAGGVPSTITGLFENGEIGVLINWLATNGTAKILAEPTLTVLSGHAASFLAGGEFAVPTIIGVDGAQGTSTTFRGYGTSLLVMPTIIDRDLIRMRIIPEFSQIDPSTSVNGIPGLNSRRAQTTIELREGQTVAVAGLISRQQSTESTRIPFLGELPLVGPVLFNAKRATEDESELLILVTPELIRPMEPDEVPPVPGHEVTHPNDYELYRWGMTEGAPDTRVYQLAPYGRGAGHGMEVGYSVFNPTPAAPGYAPQPSAPYGPQPQAGPQQYQNQQGYPTPAGPPNGYQPPLTPSPDPSMSQQFAPRGLPYNTPSGVQPAGHNSSRYGTPRQSEVRPSLWQRYSNPGTQPVGR